MKTVEFNEKQIDRIDDVHHAVYDCILSVIGVGVNKEDFPWDMSIIGPVTENIIGTLLAHRAVDKIYFPSRVQERNGDIHIEDYYKLED